MIIQFSRAEVERIVIDYANRRLNSNPFDTGTPPSAFNAVSCSGYRDIPDTVSVITEEPTDAAQ